MEKLGTINHLFLEPLVRAALLEDLGRRGDVTTDAIIPAGVRGTAVLASRQDGIIAGLDAAQIAFRLLDPAAVFEIHVPDGAFVKAGQAVMAIEASARALLTAERTALNIVCRLSGIATATARLVEAVKGTGAKIVCTRKTTPGLRALEKYAVRMGGGHNHRFGLDDAILIKDNHIALAGGLLEAVRRAKEAAGHMLKIEVEVDTLDQLADLLTVGADAVLLDNMDPATLKKAVALVAGRMTTEASGRVSPENVRAIAEAGVDMISSGWITHSAPILDLGLDIRT